MDEKNLESIDLSIIIVNYNSPNLLQNCVDSIYEFTKGISYEVIVVDNNSTDSNIEVVFENLKEKIILIRNKTNEGFGKANNIGLNAAKGKYVLFLNNDTLFFENTLKILFDFLEAEEGDALVSCKLLNEDKTLQHSTYDFPTVLNVFTANFFLYLLFPKSKYFNKYYLMNNKVNEITETEVIIGAFIFGPTDKIKLLNGFDERFYFYDEDTDLCYRFNKRFGKIFYYPKTAIIHLKGKSTSSRLKFKYKNRFESMVKFYLIHFSKPRFLLAYIFHICGLLIRIPILLLKGLVTFNKTDILLSYYYLQAVFTFPRI